MNDEIMELTMKAAASSGAYAKEEDATEKLNHNYTNQNDAAALKAKRDEHKDAVVAVLSKLPPDEMQIVMRLMGDEKAPEVWGPVLSFWYAAQFNNRLMSKEMEKLRGDLQNLQVATKQLSETIESIPTKVDTLETGIHTALETLLKSFGAGLKRVLPEAIGSSVGPMMRSAVSESMEGMFYKLTWKGFAFLAGSIIIVLLAGVGLGAVIVK